ncbi:bifunctional metallophosphatase/5'-nucleotidase [Vibrio sp.]|uniref:bifunctional metallophosphatase/5'-nucleotidase n=1 Tax=Vibrio sp. TaxID=678 RepID=UPI003D1303DE
MKRVKNRKMVNKPARITLAHINDTHSYFEPTSLQLHIEVEEDTVSPFVSAGGFARIATRIHQLREDAGRQQRKLLFLHAGDCFQGTLYFSLFKGKANADMLNALGIDAMTLGNHELDMGNLPLAQFCQRINFPLLAGNWQLGDEVQDKPATLKYNPRVYSHQPDGTARWLTKMVDGEPVAIFGLSLDLMAAIANPDPDTPFVDATATARATVNAIRQQGINKIILLSHLGYDADCELARQVEGISIIVGGHSHRLQGDFSDLGLGKDDQYGIQIGQTYVVQAGYHALTLGHCDIDFAADGAVTSFTGKNELLLGRRLFLNANMDDEANDSCHGKACEFLNNHSNVVICKKDPDVQGLLVERYLPRVRKMQLEVIGNTEQPVRHVRIPDELGPSELAPLVAESFAYALNQRGCEVEFAIHNAGGVRSSLNAGDVTLSDVAGKLLPFMVPIGHYNIAGRYIALALEGAINNATNNGVTGTGSGSFPYTHNLDYVYHPDRPAGFRIADLQIYNSVDGWQPVDPDKKYRGSSSAYTMKGKEGFHALLEMEHEGVVTELSMSDCFIEWLQSDPHRLNRHKIKKWYKGC